MIRSALASPWLPLTYWTVTICIALCTLSQYPVKRYPRLQSIAKISDLVVVQVSPPQEPVQSLQRETSVVRDSGPSHVWRAGFLCLRSFERRPISVEVETRTAPTTFETRPIRKSPPITMLSIRANPAEQSAANALSIQCRTSLAVTNAHSRAVSIHGVVTQEVVSSAGKILIMAGSRVVGSGVFDPESGRLRSNGIWTIVFDDTELKVRALLLDRPGGLLGVAGESANSEASAESRGRSILVVPGNALFTLELHGEIQLQDSASNESEY